MKILNIIHTIIFPSIRQCSLHSMKYTFFSLELVFLSSLYSKLNYFASQFCFLLKFFSVTEGDVLGTPVLLGLIFLFLKRAISCFNLNLWGSENLSGGDQFPCHVELNRLQAKLDSFLILLLRCCSDYSVSIRAHSRPFRSQPTQIFSLCGRLGLSREVRSTIFPSTKSLAT